MEGEAEGAVAAARTRRRPVLTKTRSPLTSGTISVRVVRVGHVRGGGVGGVAKMNSGPLSLILSCVSHPSFLQYKDL